MAATLDLDVGRMADLDYRLGGRRYILNKGRMAYTLIGGKDFENGFLHYNGRTGLLICRKGYSWDGCSIPKYVFWLRRTKKTKIPGLLHDAPYQLARNGVFDEVPNARKIIDGYFWHNLKARDNGYSKAWQMYKGVRVFGASSFTK